MVKKPRYFAFALTDRCQSRCSTCSGWQTPSEKKSDELSTNDWKFVLSSLKDWIGKFDFIFTGGEPFLRDDIFELADYAANIGIQPKVITNALALHHKCEKVINSGFTDITISLNSVMNPAIHDASRGRKNAFKITSDVIQNLTYLNRSRKAGKLILIASVIMPSNLSEMVPLAEFAHTNGIGINYQLLDGGESFFTAYDIMSESLKMYDEMKQETIDAIDTLINLKSKGYLIYNTNNQLLAFKDLILNSPPQEENLKKNIETNITQNLSGYKYNIEPIKDKIDTNNIHRESMTPFAELFPDKAAKLDDASCQIGDYNFLIDPYGNVRVCFSFEPIGSLLNMTPENIWISEAAENMRKKIAKCEKSCKLLNCNYHEGDN